MLGLPDPEAAAICEDARPNPFPRPVGEKAYHALARRRAYTPFRRRKSV